MKPLILPLLALLLLIGLYFSQPPKNTPLVTSESDAITRVKESFPEFQSYPSNNLPPKSIEVIKTKDGWRVGMYMAGSGLPGILIANCFLVTYTGVVTETGMFGGEGPAKAINLSTCTPKE